MTAVRRRSVANDRCVVSVSRMGLGGGLAGAGAGE